jgi:NAD(P)H dehydrogenase (quinone)
VRIAVTGSTGTLGSQVVDLLATTGRGPREVLALARRPDAVPAALALLPPSGRHHDLTGPEAFTFEGLAGVLTGIAGIPVSYTDVPARVLVEELARSGEDPWWTYAYSTMFASVREDRWGTVSGEVLRLTGRAPSSVAEVLRPAA